MPEFELIRRLQEFMQAPAGACALGIGDDAAILDVPADRQLVVCTDTLVGGVHFPADTPPRAVGYKSLAVNLSDLAAMGAEPAWFFLALALPDGDPAWIDEFARGMAGLAGEAGIVLAGGDTTSGSLCITVTAVGLVEKGRALTRSGARPGDRVVVSGEPGRAANALRRLKAGERPDESDLTALEYPAPRLALGRALLGQATSCIDISDGLAADLGHILEQSGVGARIDLARLPCAETLAGLPEEERWALQLAGGDDYELCFTLSPGDPVSLAALSARCGLELTQIGKITSEASLVLERPDGRRYETASTGYEHFAGADKAGG